MLVKGATGRRPDCHHRGSQAGTLPSRPAATTHPRAGQAQIRVCECPAPEGLPRPDTDEKAPQRAGHPEAAARRRRHCQSTEFRVLRRQMVNIWRYLLRHFCRCHRYHNWGNKDGLASLLLRYMVSQYFETRTILKFGALPICTEQTKSWWLQLLNKLCSREVVESPICVISLLLLDLSLWLHNAL